jgi:preprotein translocase subunit SecG
MLYFPVHFPTLSFEASAFSQLLYRGADKFLARSTSLFFLMLKILRLMLVLYYIYSTNIPPITIINRIYETQNLLSL